MIEQLTDMPDRTIGFRALMFEARLGGRLTP
jgi:hypothetical protein